MKSLAITLLLFSSLLAGGPMASSAKPAKQKYPLPLPKSYKMPSNIQEIVLDLYRKADSVVEFRERYKIIYEDKWELKQMLYRLLDQRMEEANSGKYGLRYGDALFFEAAELKDQVAEW